MRIQRINNFNQNRRSSGCPGRLAIHQPSSAIQAPWRPPEHGSSPFIFSPCKDVHSSPDVQPSHACTKDLFIPAIDIWRRISSTSPSGRYRGASGAGRGPIPAYRPTYHGLCRQVCRKCRRPCTTNAPGFNDPRPARDRPTEQVYVVDAFNAMRKARPMSECLAEIDSRRTYVIALLPVRV